jgi:hypothetical protein
LKHHFWLGMRGFFGAAVWLFIPTALYASADKNEDAAGAIVVSAIVGLTAVFVAAARNRRSDPQFELRHTVKFSAVKSRLFSFPTIVFAPLAVLYVLFVLLGAVADDPDPVRFFRALFSGIALAMVLSWLPFLQARFAAENRLGAMFELSTIRKLFKQSPVMWLFAVVMTFVLALPLYLAKVRLPPQDAMWLVTTIFIVSIYPARVLTGWAYHRAVRRGRPAWFGLRWISRGVMIPLLAVFVFLLFFTQYIGQEGKWTLYANHAFLLPVPF